VDAALADLIAEGKVLEAPQGAGRAPRYLAAIDALPPGWRLDAQRIRGG
jgi:hypothetical protein